MPPNSSGRTVRRAGKGRLDVALGESLHFEHHLAAHHVGDDFQGERAKHEATLPVGGVVVAAPGEETAAAINVSLDDELPG